MRSPFVTRPRHVRRPSRNAEPQRSALVLDQLEDRRMLAILPGQVVSSAGYLDADGRLYFCGRRAHVVMAGRRPFHSVPVENVFNRHPEVRRTALIGIDGTPALAVEPRSRSLSADDRRRLAAELGAIGAADPVTAPIRRFYFHPSFPVDARHNAKIFRDRLGAWAATQPFVEVDGPDAGDA